MSKPIFVAGATGVAGQAYVHALLTGGHTVRASVRPGDESGWPDGVEPRAVDFTDEHSARQALEGADAVVIALAGRGDMPAEDEATITRIVAHAAEAVGVQHVVYTSVHQADQATGVPHFEVKGTLETELRQLFPRVTVLRPTTFAEALTAPWLRHGIEERGTLASPVAIDAPISYVATYDLARIAAAALHEPALQSETVTVAGPAPTTYADLLPLLSELAGRPVQYHQIPRADVLRNFGPDLTAMTDLFNTHGFTATPSPVLHRLDLAPRPLEVWLRDAWPSGAAPATPDPKGAR